MLAGSRFVALFDLGDVCEGVCVVVSMLCVEKNERLLTPIANRGDLMSCTVQRVNF